MSGAVREELARILRYGLVGVSVAGFYAMLYAGFRWLGAIEAVANIAAFLIAIGWQYLAQTLFTFRAPLASRAQAVRFAATVTAGLATSTLLTGWLWPLTGWPEWGAVLAVMLGLPVQNYVLFRLWVYRGPSGAPRGEGEVGDGLCL